VRRREDGVCCRIVVVADEDSGAGTHARWLTALLREGRDATAVAGEDGGCANGGRWWRCHGVDGTLWWPENKLHGG